jgi:hypothetical protein
MGRSTDEYRTESNQVTLTTTADTGVNEVFAMVRAELDREVAENPERDDMSDDYANRKLAHAAHMYVVGGKRKARGEGSDSYTQAAEFYPISWGGKERGAELLRKLTPVECYVRACALLMREIRRTT